MIRTTIAVIATLLLAGYMTGDHGVKRMVGAGDPSKRGAPALAQSRYRQRRSDYADPHLQIGRQNLL